MLGRSRRPWLVLVMLACLAALPLAAASAAEPRHPVDPARGLVYPAAGADLASDPTADMPAVVDAAAVERMRQAGKINPEVEGSSAEKARLNLLKVVNGRVTGVPVGDAVAAPAVGSPSAPGVAGSESTLPNAPGTVATWLTHDSNDAGFFPPDSTIAVGTNDGISSVNSTLKAWSKSGSLLWAASSLKASLPAASVCGTSGCSTSGWMVFDPSIVYDRISNRYVLVLLSVNDALQKSRTILAVSRGSTAGTSLSSGFWIYSIDSSQYNGTSTNEWADYEKVGVTGNAIVITSNQYNWGGSFAKAKLTVWWKSQVYAGAGANLWQYGWPTASSPFTVQPASSTVNDNVAYLLATTNGSSSSIKGWRLTVPTTPGNTPSLSTATAVSVTGYSIPPDANQPGTTAQVDTGDSRMLQAVRTTAGIFAVHNTGCTLSGDASVRACVRFYQFSTAWSKQQDRTFGSPYYYYFYPAVAAADGGGLVMPFQAVSKANGVYLGTFYTGRKGTDSPNVIQGVGALSTGQGCYERYVGDRNRAGDYSGASWDKSTGRFWLMAERATGTSSNCTLNRWQTHASISYAP